MDGGITLVLHCPGQQPVSVVEDLTVNTYISLCELMEGGKELNKHLALMVQTFGTEVALLTCDVSLGAASLKKSNLPLLQVSHLKFTAPTPKILTHIEPRKSLKVDSNSYLPNAVMKDGPYIRP